MCEENGSAPQPVAAESAPGNSLDHTLDRTFERYGFYVRPAMLSRAIEQGLAIYVGLCGSDAGRGDRKVYNVPVDNDGTIVYVKCIYAPPSQGRTHGKIITVLPQDRLSHRKTRAHQEQEGQRKKKYARDFRRNNADEDFDS